MLFKKSPWLASKGPACGLPGDIQAVKKPSCHFSNFVFRKPMVGCQRRFVQFFLYAQGLWGSNRDVQQTCCRAARHYWLWINWVQHSCMYATWIQFKLYLKNTLSIPDGKFSNNDVRNKSQAAKLKKQNFFCNSKRSLTAALWDLWMFSCRWSSVQVHIWNVGATFTAKNQQQTINQ